MPVTPRRPRRSSHRPAAKRPPASSDSSNLGAGYPRPSAFSLAPQFSSHFRRLFEHVCDGLVRRVLALGRRPGTMSLDEATKVAAKVDLAPTATLYAIATTVVRVPHAHVPSPPAVPPVLDARVPTAISRRAGSEPPALLGPRTRFARAGFAGLGL
ncbi:hypothetical protein C8Q80DRAFT_1265583 [Daedaleopsis nitida]|nr:hypothetical protein C8Q80DRAFT_1265583 [Daedaleopsis nitida]